MWLELLKWEQQRDPDNRFYDRNEWIVIQNIPDNPPGNLIVLATRNVDPSSLRTKLADGDMQKHIRFVANPGFPLFERNSAILVRADGVTVRVRKEAMTYAAVYRGQTFDVTTNRVDGAQTKYLLPDGKEVVPDNG